MSLSFQLLSNQVENYGVSWHVMLFFAKIRRSLAIHVLSFKNLQIVENKFIIGGN